MTSNVLGTQRTIRPIVEKPHNLSTGGYAGNAGREDKPTFRLLWLIVKLINKAGKKKRRGQYIRAAKP